MLSLWSFLIFLEWTKEHQGPQRDVGIGNSLPQLAPDITVFIGPAQPVQQGYRVRLCWGYIQPELHLSARIPQPHPILSAFPNCRGCIVSREVNVRWLERFQCRHGLPRPGGGDVRVKAPRVSLPPPSLAPSSGEFISTPDSQVLVEFDFHTADFLESGLCVLCRIWRASKLTPALGMLHS